jgi:hypothetical protein
MNSELETKLQRQIPRQIPAEWRAEILAASRSGVSAERRKPVYLDGGFLPKAATPTWLTNLLWPHPKAWAGLAAVWVLILALQVGSRDDSGSRAVTQSAPPSPEMVAELKKQQRMFAELVGSREELVADRSKPYSPRPRGERMNLLVG